MIPGYFQLVPSMQGIPRESGDDPWFLPLQRIQELYSPRERG